jgi:hypothetical protein
MDYQIICEDCDSEYQLQYQTGMVADTPQYCSICGSEIEPYPIDTEE